jgi:hypothetical protein
MITELDKWVFLGTKRKEYYKDDQILVPFSYITKTEIMNDERFHVSEATETWDQLTEYVPRK